MFNTFLVTPLYNGFVVLLDLLPFADAGVVIILFTIIVSWALYPVSRKALATQLHMKEHEKEIAELKEKYKGNKEEQARKLLAFYKERGINPFSSVLLVLIQIPVIIALYSVFIRAGLPVIDTARLYSFIHAPEVVSMMFLGLIDISKKSIVLGLFAALTQLIQGWFSPAMAAPVTPKKQTGAPSFEESLASSMRVQTRYFLPVIIFMVSYSSGVIALYFTTRSLFTFVQELIMRRRTKAAVAVS